jgi:outer membrane receptor protein involved in Fe transport
MINIGFKEANPSLLPERIDHYALAARYQPVSHFTISGAISYSMGNDYIYYTETGETLFGGRRKVYQRTNLNKVEAIAGELSVEWQPAMWLRVHASTLLNQSIIVSNAVLQGKSLAYAPGHIEAIGIITENNIVNASATIIYKGEQYMDDENSTSIPAQAIVNLKLYRVFVKHYRLSFTAQNLFDVTYLTDGFNLSLGRFLSAGVEVIF